jgi:hypothetical protein
MASHFGVAATVFVPEVMLPETAAAIEAEGAQVVRLDVGYDEAVLAASAYSVESDGRALVQDTAWEGYTEVPAWIVDGYRTLLEEVDEQLGGHRTWSRCRLVSDHWPRRWYVTTVETTPRIRACCRSSPTPRRACWRACTPASPSKWLRAPR